MTRSYYITNGIKTVQKKYYIDTESEVNSSILYSTTRNTFVGIQVDKWMISLWDVSSYSYNRDGF